MLDPPTLLGGAVEMDLKSSPENDDSSDLRWREDSNPKFSILLSIELSVTLNGVYAAIVSGFWLKFSSKIVILAN